MLDGCSRDVHVFIQQEGKWFNPGHCVWGHMTSEYISLLKLRFCPLVMTRSEGLPVIGLTLWWKSEVWLKCDRSCALRCVQWTLFGGWITLPPLYVCTLQVSQALHTMQTDLLPPAGEQGSYRGILFPSMLIFTAPCGRPNFLCSAKRRLCFSSRLMAFLQPLYRGPITAQLLTWQQVNSLFRALQSNRSRK